MRHVKRVISRLREHDWFEVFVELLVVIFGILIAFQIDRWREQRFEQDLERAYVDRLLTDIELDIPRIQESIRLAEKRQQYATLLLAVKNNEALAFAEPGRFVYALEAATYTNLPELTRHTFDDLRATGHLRLLRNEALKLALYAYHDYDVAQRQWLPLSLDLERHAIEVLAGVLSAAQIEWLSTHVIFAGAEQADNAMKSAPFTVVDIRHTLERFRDRPQAVHFLPQLLLLQTDQRMANEHRLMLAQKLQSLLQAYRGELFSSDK